ncbi:hypothetical protein F1880_005643 [Penicillium rolfsii]|nr:hypothetical protein F1880_005643 [Penicillium rolfsii]
MSPVRGKWTTVDMDEIKLCQDLIDELEVKYVDEDKTTVVATTPAKIFQNSNVALWARTYLGTKTISLGLPSMKEWLGNLALCGPGRSEMYDGVEYRFVRRWPKNETTTPESDLQ